MDHASGGSCPLPGCPDQYGTMPECAGLAVPYVPFQQENPVKYSQLEALSAGTLYPGLNLPFYLAAEVSTLPEGPLTQLQALSFVVLELGHYLDTHPEDVEAYTLYRKYAAAEKAARSQYEQENGPLTRTSDSQEPQYDWLREPWPWNYREGGGL